jgi:sporadic carbohydrate cluster 2OG-Fe(II) oxygenase
MFLSKSDQQLSNEYIKEGYIIKPVADNSALEWIRSQFIRIISNELNIKTRSDYDEILNQIHKLVPISELNSFRLKIFQSLNSLSEFRKMYFKIAQPYLESIVGNELAMQLRINLSIQFPDDESSLLPIHADTWSGDSAYEVVVWIPLVDCYRTKSMYILPPDKENNLNQNFNNKSVTNSEELYESIIDDVKQLEVSYGEVLIFNQALPHGNRINKESETRWSMNCRFKGLFTPYKDKKIGEFFEPITMRAASRVSMNYKLPSVK